MCSGQTYNNVLCIIQFFKVIYSILTLQVPLALLSVFSRTNSVFLKKTPRSEYSAIHALGLVSGSTSPWKYSGLYKP